MYSMTKLIKSLVRNKKHKTYVTKKTEEKEFTKDDIPDLTSRLFITEYEAAAWPLPQHTSLYFLDKQNKNKIL